MSRKPTTKTYWKLYWYSSWPFKEWNTWGKFTKESSLNKVFKRLKSHGHRLKVVKITEETLYP